MSATEYAKRAQQCVDLANTMSPAHRAIVLNIAEAWLKLAADAVMHERMDAEEAKPAPLDKWH